MRLGYVLAGLGLLGLVGLAARGRAGLARVVSRIDQARPTAYVLEHSRSRDASKLWAVVLHQMGFSRGSDPSRYDAVNAHYVILPDGGTYQLYGHEVRLPAASALNTGSVSVEFAGNFPSRARSQDPRHFWSPDTAGMDQLTDAQIKAGRALLADLHARGFTTVLAHRQGGAQRQNDPGPDVWREVAAWGVRQLGMEWGGPGWKAGSGQPIPDHWWGSEVA
jgi:N-acetyl-anhydromuramyl-L-alanine amidase AmpD